MITILEKRIQLFEFDKCPECGGDILQNSFELICRDCGLVIDKNFKNHILKKYFTFMSHKITVKFISIKDI